MRIFLLFLLLTSLRLLGQDSLSAVEKKPSPVLKWSVLSLVDPVSSYQFAFEYPIGRKLSLQHEAGWVTRIFYNYDTEDKNIRGFRTRHELRYFLKGVETALEGLYVGPELMYTYLWFERNPGEGGVCPNECPDYPDYPVQKAVFALHPKLGYQKLFNRFALDLYAGVGYRYVRVKVPPHISENLHDYFNFRKEAGTYNLLSFSGGFKIGYVLFKRD